MSENPFHILKSRSKEDWQSDAETAYEHTMVKRALALLKLTAESKAMSARTRNVAGRSNLKFADFNSMVPNFPVTLGCSKMFDLEAPLHRNEKAIHPFWFKTFMHLPFIPYYEEFWDSLGLDTKLKPVAMAFPRKGFRYGLIVHNGDLEKFVAPNSSCHLYLGGGRKPQTLIVQPFDGFLEYLVKDKGSWKNEN
jgi:hypothetical protein